MATSDKNDDDDQSKTTFPEWVDPVPYKGFWLIPDIIQSVSLIENQFKPQKSDIILASFPKTGTTWLKALTVTILNHTSKASNEENVVDHDQLVTHSPHELVPFLELEIFGPNPIRNIDTITSSPRVFNTHIPYSILPDHIKSSGCKFVYITRRASDTLVSYWHFFNKRRVTPMLMEDQFDDFCKGAVHGGPYFEHVLEYWNASENNETMLFVTYEDLKEEPCKHVKRLAEFLGCELDSDQIEQVVKKCSIERLSKLEVNKDSSKVIWSGAKSSSYFRQGVIGDSKNYLSLEMMERLTEMANQKWGESGLVGSSLMSGANT